MRLDLLRLCVPLRCWLVLLVLPALLGASSVARGEAAAPGWAITTSTYPTDFSPGGKGAVLLQLLNIGAASSSGEVTVTDELPRGVTAIATGVPKQLGGNFPSEPETHLVSGFWDCAIAPGSEENSVVICHNDPVNLPSIAGGGGMPTYIEEFYGGNLQPSVGIAVSIGPAAGEGKRVNRMRVEGGGAANAVSAVDPMTISSDPPAFGLTHWDGWFSKRDGEFDTTAGSVPYAFTTTFDLNTVLEEHVSKELKLSGSETRDFEVELPSGFIGSPRAVPQCTRRQFDEQQCAPDTIVGLVEADTAVGINPYMLVYNLVPPVGLPAQFGFMFNQIATFIDPKLRTGGDYGVTARINNIPQKNVIASTVTLWGVPDDPSHEPWRCFQSGPTTFRACHAGGPPELGPHPELKPFLRMPTSCTGSVWVSASINGWFERLASFTEPLTFASREALEEPTGLSGCGQLPFTPSVTARPSTSAADSPSGMQFDLHNPQPEVVKPVEGEENGEAVTIGGEPALHEADLKDATVTFPAGLSIDPSSADGLGTCSEAQVGFLGFKELNNTAEPGVRTPQFTPGPAECPDSSKLGTVEVDTPLLSHPLPGAVYLARQGENPFGSLLALYIAIDDPTSGVVVKLPGLIEANPATGQLTVSVDRDPQVPFEDFKIGLFGGSRAALTTPQTCGSYTTSSSLTPWSSPEGGLAMPSDSFEVTEAPSGGACAASAAQEPNAPVLSAGSFTPIGGAYSPFVLRLSRENGSQRLAGLSATLPEGLLGKIAGVEECSQAGIEAAERRGGEGEGKLELASPSCPAGSLVGLAHVGAGAGAPLYVTGRAYLAGPYRGAPFSIVVIAPAVAGPFDLGVVVVRNALFIDPVTAQVRVVSDPLPRIRDGIPFDIRSIEVEVTRPDFTFNPTSCEKMQVTGAAQGEGGAQAAISSPFQVGGCTGLPFKPAFSVSTQAKTSRLGGASLEATIEVPPAAAGSNQAGSQANTHSIKVELPKQLSARLTTLQKACTAAVFEANPAACPAASAVGQARVITPILPVALEGPAYFVSYGNSKWPELVLVLQGDGVTVDIHGETFISKTQITSTTFGHVPDAPYTSVSLTLPEGPYSALSPAGDLCGSKLVMPTLFTGQNGAVFRQSTQINVLGCATAKTKAKTKALTRAQKLKRALKACRKDRAKRRRVSCEAHARSHYGQVGKHKRKR
jgi:hypothetical protein